MLKHKLYITVLVILVAGLFLLIPGTIKSLSASGGPDLFGYTLKDSSGTGGPTYAWEEISGSGALVQGWTSVNNGYAGPIQIGFNFKYYDHTYSELYVGTNGYLSFGQGYSDIPSGVPPQVSAPNNDIALFGGDMFLDDYGNESKVFYQMLSAPTRFVLEYVNLHNCCTYNTPRTFEVILYPNGDIQAQYQSLNGTTTDTVGIENIDGTDGLGYGMTLCDGLAIRYYFPVGVLLVPPEQSAFGFVGASITYTLHLKNQTGAADDFTISTLPGNIWPTTLSITQTGVISDGKAITFTAQVDIPLSAAPGAKDSVFIQATSVTSPTVYKDTAMLTTTVTSEEIAYVSLPDDNKLALVDVATHSVIGSVDLAADGCYGGYSTYLSPGGTKLYVMCGGTSNIAILDTATNSLIATIPHPTADGAVAFTHDGAYALISYHWKSQIDVIDTATHNIIKSIITPSGMNLISTHPYLNLAYAAATNGSVFVIDTKTFELSTTIPFDSEITDVEPSPDGKWLFASERWGAGIAVIDAYTNKTATLIPDVGEIYALDITPDGSRLFAARLISGNVQVIDAQNFSTITSIQVGGVPFVVETTCDGKELFVGNSTNLVPVIDTQTNNVIDQISVRGIERWITICPQYFTKGVLLDPPEQSKLGGRGEVVTYQETLLNATYFTDTFTLDTGNHQWETSLSTAVIGPIAHGESVTFTVSVTVPENTNWYANDTVVVTATSVTSPTGYTATATFTTTAYALPQISVSPNSLSSTQPIGDVTTRTMMISNGNGVTLTYDIAKGSFPGNVLLPHQNEPQESTVVDDTSYQGGLTGGDIPWLGVKPISGTVPTNGEQPLQVTMDASSMQSGVYTTTLFIRNNDLQNPVVTVPVKMTISEGKVYLPIICR